jgi:uncharacterized coiled-coil protein SlyX
MLPFITILKLLKNCTEGMIKHWKPIIVILMVLTIVYQNFILTQYVFGLDTLPSLRQTIIEQQENIDTITKANKTLSDTIDARNKEVLAQKNLSEKFENQLQTLSDELQKYRDKTNKKAADILNDKTPKTCEDAIEYLREGRRDLNWD